MGSNTYFILINSAMPPEKNIVPAKLGIINDFNSRRAWPGIIWNDYKEKWEHGIIDEP